jgi:RNA polymerase sigma-70 factor (ECF subfamily)
VIETGAGGVDAFEQARPRLLGLAYRMLGTVADAEDAVQDAWLRWQAADQAAIDSPAAWLTTVATRLCLDRLRATQRRREEYVGPWLPEPIALDRGPEESAELADSLTLGFLVLLDELRPVERAVFVLADVFAVPFSEIARVVGRSEAACRQIASRARRRVQGASPRRGTEADRAVIQGLLYALAVGDTDAALARLAPDAVLLSDGGATRRAARKPVVGASRVARFIANLLKRYTDFMVEPATLNGAPAMLVSAHGELDNAIVFEVHDGLVSRIHVVRNPDKLAHVARPVPLE